MAYRITLTCQGCQACVRICPTQAINGERYTILTIEPERCIECGTCGRVCPYDAVEEPDGSPAQRVKRADWEKPVIDPQSCISCGLCIATCPVSCLDYDESQIRSSHEGIPYLKIPKTCLGCGFCAAVCPVGAIRMVVGSLVSA
ncbi:MAG TPA: ferredoxin [Anaerolineaceae bacterium]|nr:ferredoxin [Anaerolineaceae bacterium]